jgi:ABC-type antimicrobial peptide transport system permease subunit
MILALSCVAEAQIYIDSVQGRIFDNFMEDEGYTDHFDLSIKGERIIPNGDLNRSIIDSNIAPLHEAMEVTDTTRYFKHEVWTLKYDIHAYFHPIYAPEQFVIKNTSIYSFETQIIQEFSSLMVPGSQIPQNNGEVVLLNISNSSFNYHGLNVNTLVNVRSGSDPGVNKTLKIVGIINLKYNDLETTTYQKFSLLTGTKDMYDPQWMDYYFLTTNDILFNILEEFRDYQPDQGYSRYNPEFYIESRVFFNRYVVNLFEIEKEKEILSRLLENINEKYTDLTPFSTIISFFLLDALDLFTLQSFDIITFLLLFSLPLIGIALFLVIFSSGLVKEKKNVILGYQKSKGLTTNEIALILIVEKITELIIAIPIAFLLAILFSITGLLSDDFLSFGNITFYLVVDVPKIIMQLIITGIIFSLLVNYKYFSSLIRLDVTSITKPTESDNTSPLWKKNYLDIVILAIGLFGFFLLYVGAYAEDLPGETYLLIYYLGVPSPFLLVIGLSLLVSRTFPRFLRILSNIAWKFEGNIVSLSLKSMLRHKQAVTRSIILIMLTISFGTIALTIPSTLENHYQHVGSYWTGADMFVNYEVQDSIAGYNDGLEKQLANISEVDGFSPVVVQNRYSRQAHYLMMGIDLTTFERVAFFNPNYGLSDSLINLMKALNSSKDAILLRNVDMRRMGKNIGDNITIRSTFYNYTTARDEVSGTKQMTIVGSFNYWPRLVTHNTNSIEDGFFFVGNISLAFDLANVFSETSIEYGYYVRIASSSSLKEVSSKVYDTTGLAVTDVMDNVNKYTSPSTWKVFLGILNTNIIIAIIIAATSVYMLTYHQIIGREKEIGIEKALGMDLGQSFKRIFTEQMLLVGFGLVLGAILGLILSISYMFVVTIRSLIPPFIMFYPVLYLAILFIAFSVITTIGSAIPAFLSTKIEIDKALKVE